MKYQNSYGIKNLYKKIKFCFDANHKMEIVNKDSMENSSLDILTMSISPEELNKVIHFFNANLFTFGSYTSKLQINFYDETEPNVIQLECIFKRNNDLIDQIQPVNIYLHFAHEYNYKNIRWILNMNIDKYRKLTNKAIIKGWSLNYDGLYIDGSLYIFESLKDMERKITRRVDIETI